MKVTEESGQIALRRIIEEFLLFLREEVGKIGKQRREGGEKRVERGNCDMCCRIGSKTASGKIKVPEGFSMKTYIEDST